MLALTLGMALAAEPMEVAVSSETGPHPVVWVHALEGTPASELWVEGVDGCHQLRGEPLSEHAPGIWRLTTVEPLTPGQIYRVIDGVEEELPVSQERGDTGAAGWIRDTGPASSPVPISVPFYVAPAVPETRWLFQVSGPPHKQAALVLTNLKGRSVEPAMVLDWQPGKDVMVRQPIRGRVHSADGFSTPHVMQVLGASWEPEAPVWVQAPAVLPCPNHECRGK